MHSREDVVKLLLAKKGTDVYATGGAKNQTAVHMVASRQTGTATSILRVLLNAAGKDIRLRTDGVSMQLSDQKKQVKTRTVFDLCTGGKIDQHESESFL